MRDARGNELSVAALINEPGGGNKSCDYCVRKRRRDRPESSINDVQLGPIVGNFSLFFVFFLSPIPHIMEMELSASVFFSYLSADVSPDGPTNRK